MQWPAGTLMAHLDDEVGEALLAAGGATTRGSGHVLIHQGDTEDRQVYLLRSSKQGRSAIVKVTTTLENGEDCLLGVRVHGDLVGELALLRDQPRSATVTLCSDALVHTIPAGGFTTLLERHPSIWRAMAMMIADRLDWANRRRTEMAGHSVAVRLAHVLTDLVDRHGYEVDGGFDVGVGLTQAELGRLVGAREDAVNKAMRGLRDLGLAETRYRRITVLDLANLRTFPA